MNFGTEPPYGFWEYTPAKYPERKGDASSAYSTPRTMKKWKKWIRQWTKYGKFGSNSIMRASFLDNSRVENMAGGHRTDAGRLKNIKGEAGKT